MALPRLGKAHDAVRAAEPPKPHQSSIADPLAMEVLESNMARLRGLDIASFPYMDEMAPFRVRQHHEDLTTLARCTTYMIRRKRLELEAEGPLTYDYAFPTAPKPHKEKPKQLADKRISQTHNQPLHHNVPATPPQHPQPYEITYRSAPCAPSKRPKSPPLVNASKPRQRHRRRSQPQPKLSCQFSSNPKSPRERFLHQADLAELEPCHSTHVVTKYHGHLSDYNIDELVSTTGFSRAELYTLWGRFKALCSLSKSPRGVDQKTFHRGVPLLSMEDSMFVDRIFSILDDENTGMINWPKFIRAMSALEKGDIRDRLRFLFQVYDLNKDDSIGRDELAAFFISSLMVSTPNEDLQQVTRQFVDEILFKLHPTGGGIISSQDVLNYIERSPQEDLFSLFGRTMITDAERQRNASAADRPPGVDRLLEEDGCQD
ncbi:hypothetical protein LEN26_018709 [Aphanomyces euteiches]|nr:hypothetical protein LEN26_018709 [Aphanomyces euteiches]KAH9107336.1 hypothetical protein AeMF1_017277 [Aphanomyces euteiches]KAH9197427.1 hypothetical protein AeNC1_000586 [Aphanomyces euteiches]